MRKQSSLKAIINCLSERSFEFLLIDTFHQLRTTWFHVIKPISRL